MAGITNTLRADPQTLTVFFLGRSDFWKSKSTSWEQPGAPGSQDSRGDPAIPAQGMHIEGCPEDQSAYRLRERRPCRPCAEQGPGPLLSPVQDTELLWAPVRLWLTICSGLTLDTRALRPIMTFRVSYYGPRGMLTLAEFQK